MEPIRLGPFLGANLAQQPKLLPPGVGVDSTNHKPGKGDLRPWRVPLAAATIGSGKKTIHMLKRDSTAESIVWFEWTTIVHAVNSFNADNSTKRTYYTGSGAPKVTNNIIGIAGAPYPTSYRDLGIPKPLTAPILTETVAGTGTDETRFYAYAYVSDWDEIGMPAVSAAITCKPGATISITGLSMPPTGTGNNRGINRMRFWRIVPSQSGTDFYFLFDITPATSTTDAAVTPGTDTMPSKTWAMPPTSLKNLIGLWNGMMAGISGNSVRYCEPFMPHAWPAEYETLTADTPIALGAFQKNLVIATTGRPRIVYGSAPEAMDDSPVELLAACVSPQSMVSFGHGCCWAAQDGLAYVGTSGPPRLLTDGLMMLDDWKALNPETIVACQFDGRYFGFYDSGGGVMKGFEIDPLNPTAIRFLSAGYAAAFFDELSEQMYVLDGTSIKKWDAGASDMTVSHKTKVFKLQRPENPGVAEVIADGYPMTFKLWAGKYSDKTGWPAGSLRITKTVLNSDAFTLPSGYLADDIQIEISGAYACQGAAIAATIDELYPK